MGKDNSEFAKRTTIPDKPNSSKQKYRLIEKGARHPAKTNEGGWC
jgi:hypothetical protein